MDTHASISGLQAFLILRPEEEDVKEGDEEQEGNGDLEGHRGIIGPKFFVEGGTRYLLVCCGGTISMACGIWWWYRVVNK